MHEYPAMKKHYCMAWSHCLRWFFIDQLGFSNACPRSQVKGAENCFKMESHATQMPELPGTIPLGRGLMPEELADYKAKGREWSRLYKEKRRKEFSAEQVEERKMKNRWVFYATGTATKKAAGHMAACQSEPESGR